MKSTKIGILGSGEVSKTLSNGFLKYNNPVMVGTRNIEKLYQWKKETDSKIIIGSFDDTAQFGEIIVLAVNGTAALQVLNSIAPEYIKGKVIIDVTNPIAQKPPVNGVIEFFTQANKSLLEQLQESFPNSNFVKAFNSVGNALMVNPDFKGLKPSMFICGNNEEAKKTVEEILTIFGWETEDMGKAESARAIESLCILWCIPGLLKNEWAHAFKLLKK